MKRKCILLIICFSIVFLARAQFTVRYSAGYGNYPYMNGIKSVLNRQKDNISFQIPGLDIRIVDDFPAYFTHTIDLGYKIKRMELGINSSFLTTGGRLSYIDYSGKIDDKILLQGFREGLFFRYHFYSIPIKNHARFSFYGELAPACLFSTIKENFLIALYDPNNGQIIDENNNTETIHKFNFSVMPSLGINFFMNNRIGIHCGAGFDFDFAELKNEYLTPDWTGIRIFVGISYTLSK